METRLRMTRSSSLMGGLAYGEVVPVDAHRSQGVLCNHRGSEERTNRHLLASYPRAQA